MDQALSETRPGLFRSALHLLLVCSFLSAAVDGGAAEPGEGSKAPFVEGFQNPPAESRILKIIHSWPDEPAAQDGLIRSLSTQGFGGVVCNVSFSEYLRSEPRWKAFVRAVEAANKAGFALWLYDEKGYPSATAGGLTLRDHPEWEARGLLVATAETQGEPVNLEVPPGQPMLAAAFPITNRGADLKGKIDLTAHVKERKLAWTPPGGTWAVVVMCEDRLYEGTHAAMNLAGHIPYPNLLQHAPAEKFLELTHNAYARHLGKDLGRYFVATFTDEPSLMSLFLKTMPYKVLPWSAEFPAEFNRRRGYQLDESLAALVLDAPQAGRTRYDFWRTVGELVSENFFGAIQDWCAGHGLASGGHLLMEESLVNHVPLYGDFFACLRKLDAPSIDCLTSIPEQVPWSIARMAGSAADLERKPTTMCETSDHGQRYRPPGDKRPVRRVTPAEIRGTCNRLMAGGINTITSYYSFDGLSDEALRDLNQYIGRCCFALKGGHQVCDVAVLMPTESLWTAFQPSRNQSNESPRPARIAAAFDDVSEALFVGRRDFTYIDSRAINASRVEKGALVHRDLQWRVVILPGVDTLPLQTWEKLAAFAETGGVVIAIGRLPANSETEFPSAKVTELAHKIFGSAAGAADRNQPGSLSAFEPICSSNRAMGAGIYLPAGLAGMVGRVVDRLLEPDLLVADPEAAVRFTHRRINGQEVYFLINDSPFPWSGKVSVPGEGQGTRWDPVTGNSDPLRGQGAVDLDLPGYGARVLTYAKARSPRRLPVPDQLLPELALAALPAVKPAVARGEFVREDVKEAMLASGSSASPAWSVTGNLTKGQVDTFLFVRFAYPDGLNLKNASSLVINTSVPDRQKAPAQLLVILHEKGGADYLANTGRLLNIPGDEQTWIPLKRFQLAGWSNDSNGRLDLDQISEIRVGWGGYYGTQSEKVEFTLAQPRITLTR